MCSRSRAKTSSSWLASEVVRPVSTFLPPALTFCMAETVVLPDIEREEKSGSKSDLEPGWLVICWNDPVNLMTYVTHVFQTVFGWNRQKAEFHMLEVHRQGKSVLARTTMEQAEHYVHQLQKYTLHATMERES